MTARLTIAAARPGMRVLIREIERAGLIAQEPRTTEREATISEGWWA